MGMSTLVRVALATLAVGCGTTLNVVDDEDGAGGRGDGGATIIASTATGSGGTVTATGSGGGTVASTSTGSSGVTTSTGPAPSGCPVAEPVASQPCDVPDQACSYVDAEGCTVELVCLTYQDCGGGYGGGCNEHYRWNERTRDCPGAVECWDAQSGDACSNDGESCEDFEECAYIEKWCEGGVWEVYVYPKCCTEDCECDGVVCPAEPPQDGDACVPCGSLEDCTFDYEVEGCGEVHASASCDPRTSTWSVFTDDCSATSVAVSAAGAGGGGEAGGTR